MRARFVRPLEYLGARAFAGLVVVVAGGVVFGLLLLLVRVKWGPLYQVDHGAAAELNELAASNRPLVAVFKGLSQLGGHLVLWWVVTVGTVALLIRRRYALAAYLVVTGLGALALDPVLKLIVGRLRPVVNVPVAAAPGNSFPSGHALGSIVSYGSLLLVFLPVISRRWRPFVIGAVATLVVAIGFTRVALGVHYVSDVLAGWMLGLAWLGVTAFAFRLWRHEVGKPTPPITEGLEPESAPQIEPAPREQPGHPFAASGLLLVGFVLVLGMLFGLGELVTRHEPGIDRSVPRWFFAHRGGALDGVSEFWSQAGNTHAILAVALIAAPLSVALLRQWRPVVFLVVTMFGELALFLMTERAIDRSRPAVPNMEHLPTASFPSGHVAATFCLYGAIALLALPRVKGWQRWLFWVPAVAMPVLVALSRLYRGVHHPTDILGGLILGVAWLTVTYRAVRPNCDLAEVIETRREQRSQHREPSLEAAADAGS